MNFWASYPFVRIAVVFIFGILSHEVFGPVGLSYLSSILLVLAFFLLATLMVRVTPVVSKNSWSGLFGLMAIYLLGWIHIQASHPGAQPMPGEVRGYRGVVSSNPEQLANHSRLHIRLDHWLMADTVLPAQGTAILYLKHDTLNDKTLRYGDQLVIMGTPQVIQPPTNPGQFDFSRYWALKKVYWQHFGRWSEVRITGYDPPSQLISLAYTIRNKATGYLRSAIASDQEFAVAKALILGVRDGLDNEIKTAYSGAGAMHVLAVSGLHVGILYLLINFLLRPLRPKRWGKQVIALVALLTLWLYALVTGLSPSVQRATMMFSVFVIGDLLGRPGNAYNSLAFSAFVLVMIDPLIIYQVGFQLSYLAVFGIVFFQPRIYGIWKPGSWLLDKGWELTSVSLAAQITTFPLGIYYFNQLPTLFILSNFVVIPVAFCAMMLGLLLLMLSPVSLLLAGLVGTVLSWSLWVMNQAVLFIERIDFAVLEGLYFNGLQTWMLYLLVLLVTFLVLHKRFSYFLMACCMLLLITGKEVLDLASTARTKQAVIYDAGRNCVIDFRDGFNARLFAADSLGMDQVLEYIVKNDRAQNGLSFQSIPVGSFDTWNSPIVGMQVKSWMGKRFLRLSEAGWTRYQFGQPVAVDFLIVSNNSVRNLDQVLSRFIPEMLVIDGSNSYYRSEKLEQQARTLYVNVHAIRSHGALTIKL